MAKRREVDRGDVPDIDQVLLELCWPVSCCSSVP
jgi:hypothetical protein